MTREATQAEIAGILGLQTRQIRNLEAQGLPHRAEGRRKFYPLPEAVRWVRDRDVATVLADVAPTGFDEARAREMAARAEKAELEVRKMRGELVDVAEWEREFSGPLAEIRAQLLALPGRIAAELPLPPAQSVEIIERVVHEVMSEVSEEPELQEVDDAA